MRAATITETRAKSILNKCPLDFSDWTLNPYAGCAFGCTYCYVPPLKAKLGVELPGPWGSYVDVKTNAVELLRRDMRRVAPTDRIAIGTATDPYQPVERTHRITRSLLEQLCFYENPVNIVTRSPLVIRDIDVLAKLENVSVGMSIPTADEAARRALEPNATAIPGRLEAVRRLRDAGILVSIYWMPILPGITDTRRGIRQCLEAFQPLGVRVVAGAMRDFEYFRRPYLAAHSELVRIQGIDSTQLYGREIGEEMQRVARELEVNLVIAPSLFEGSTRRVPARRKAWNQNDRRQRLVV